MVELDEHTRGGLHAAAINSGKPAVMRSCVSGGKCGKSVPEIIAAMRDGSCRHCTVFTVDLDGTQVKAGEPL